MIVYSPMRGGLFVFPRSLIPQQWPLWPPLFIVRSDEDETLPLREAPSPPLCTETRAPVFQMDGSVRRIQRPHTLDHISHSKTKYKNIYKKNLGESLNVREQFHTDFENTRDSLAFGSRKCSCDFSAINSLVAVFATPATLTNMAAETGAVPCASSNVV